MTLTLNSLVAMAWRTVRNAREGATEVLSLGVPREALWPALALVVAVSILLAQATSLLVIGSTEGPPGLPAGPLAMGFVQLALLVVMVFAIFWIGRSFGGTGSFEETILLVAWLQFIMVCLQVVQTVALLILPLLAGLIVIAGLLLFLWLLTNFIAVLHGFTSLGQVFVMIIVSAFGITLGLSIILTLIGITVPVVNGT